MFKWHTFDFEEHSVGGEDDSPNKLKFINLPEDLSNITVLDIGAWDGYFSFVCEKRGAKVTAFDSPNYSWNREEIEVAGEKVKQDGKANFLEVREKLKSNVEDVEGELDELTTKAEFVLGFDLVLDLGILYHCQDPYKHIRDLYRITKKHLILETFVDLNDVQLPVMRFYPNGEISETNTRD